MKRNLLLAQSNVLNLFQLKSLQLLIVVFLVLGSVGKTQAQTCIGPYQGFESCRTKGATGTPNTMANDGWVFSASASAGFGATNARNGSYFISLPNPVQSIVSPLLTNPDKFQFYYRSSNATNNVTFRVEYSTDSTFPDTAGAPTIVGPVFTTSGTSYSSTGQIDLSAYSSIYVRIRSLATSPMINTSLVTNAASAAGTFPALSGGTTVAINSDDAISGAIPIGFNFAYNGSIYSNVYASSNGFLSFNNKFKEEDSFPVTVLINGKAFMEYMVEVE